MALRVFHPCRFNFSDQDVRVVGSEVDGGTSLAGIQDVVAQDGGGFWQADFSGADFGGTEDDDRAASMEWRAVNAGMAGGTPVIVRLCDIWHQPVNGLVTVPHSDGTPFSDDSEYVSYGADASVAAVINGQTAGLNATIIDITIASEKPLIGGERFSYLHATWGWRAAEIIAVTDNTDGTKHIQFQPPIRGGIATGDALDFQNVRCQMRRTSQPSNALNMGLFASASITLVEDMRDPDL